MSTIVRLGPEYFPDPTKGKPVSSGDLYIGEPDLDPEIVANQIQVSALQENGTIIDISQPISTSAGGVPLYNGSPVTLTVDGPYSLKLLDSFGAQVYYVPNNFAQDVSELLFLSNYDCDLAAAIADIGSTNATLIVDCDAIIASGTEVITPATLFLDIMEGGSVDGVAGGSTETLTVLGTFSDGQYQKFGENLTVKFGDFGTTSKPKIEYALPQWWGVDGTDDYVQVQLAMDSFDATYGGFVKLTRDVLTQGDIDELNIPETVIIIDESNPAGGKGIISGSGEAEYKFVGPGDQTSGNLKPALILHNMGPDGKRLPAFLTRFGADPASPFNVWDFEFGEYSTTFDFGQIHNFNMVGAMGVSYNDGTASVTNGVATVAGVGTAWTSSMVGGEFYIESQEYSGTIKSVESGTSMTLQSVWGGATAAGEAYYIQGGTATFRTWYTLGQNGVHIYNRTSLESVPSNFDPVTVGETGVTINIGGHTIKNGNFSPNTIMRLENALNSGGDVGLTFEAAGVTDDPQKWILLNKLNGDLNISDTKDGAYITKTDSLGTTDRRSATTYQDLGAEAGTLTPDLADGSVVELITSGNLTINPPAQSNVLPYQELTFIINQSGTGGDTVTFLNTFFKIAGGAYTLTATANAVDVITFREVAGTRMFYEVSRSQDLK